ncbi:hypothetical protein VCS63_23455 [Achromobacter sp. D10]|uniref:hypothetical protein n=1 Tax=Achromobacter sp. D10 TaxID=3110765 RepID=UPI002B4AA373|nr:hypothetical protein [Achromobacter sp. D10]MEB3098813.1 hypothetical protein [Achromobacter sp. D10]
MSKQSIRPTGVEGISTPATLVDGQLLVNQIDLSTLLLAVDSDLVGWTGTCVDTLVQLEELLKAIQGITQEQEHLTPLIKLNRIAKLAAMGAYVASDIANGANCGRERFEEFATPYRSQAGGAQ